MARDSELEELRSLMSGEWEAMKYAKRQMDDAWGELQRVQDRNGPQIKALKDQHDRMYEEMKAAFQDAADAFSAGNHEGHNGAKECSSRGRRIQAEMRELPPRRRSLIDEIEPYRARWSAARDAYNDKKRHFQLAKERFDDRKAVIAAANQDAAFRAGVHQGHDVKVVHKGDKTHVYFGGIGEPDGQGHAHYVLDSFGNIEYRRDPFQEHGGHNFR